jgi:hypothetical protein
VKGNNDGEKLLSPEVIVGITNAFNNGLRQLVTSVHGIMPDEAIVLNVVTAVFVARKKCGFKEEDTRNDILAAVDTNMTWAGQLGRKT